MNSMEAVHACEFWTTNVAETQALGSSTNPEVAAAFYCTISIPRQACTDPDGKRNYDIRVGRWLTREDEETGDDIIVENPLYTEIAAVIEQRKAA